MNKSDATSVSASELTDFLYAGVAVEHSSMELTVLSALARQGLDPWREAERLAQLPRSVAAGELARTFSAARLPESRTLADRLVALLPGVRTTPVTQAAGKMVRPPSMRWMVAAAAAGMLSSLLFAGTPKPANTVAPASWFTENVPAPHGSATKAASPAGGDEVRPAPTQSPGTGETSTTPPA